MIIHEPIGQFLWQLVIQPQAQIPKNATISLALPIESGQRLKLLDNATS
jgi:hypothetical protein